MNPAQLLQHFHRMADGTDAIPYLRRFILDLAVRGKLVEQNPKDERASELLKRIQEEKSRLVKKGEIKKLEHFEPVEPKEIPFFIPPGWQVIRMGSLARKLGAGSTPLGGKSVYQNEGVPFLRSQNIHNDGLRLDDVALIDRAVHERMSGTHVQPEDMLLNITGASIGRCALVPPDFDEGNVSQHVAIIRLFAPSIREFIHLSLISPFFQKVIDDVQVGVSREGLSMQRLRLFPMLIPPLAEQHRIVSKVDELMALCDRLEAAQAERERRRERLTAATLARTADSESQLSDRQFFIRHFSRLTTRPDQLHQLRQSILNLAVRGQLVPHDPKEEPASALLRRIAKSRTNLLEHDYPNESEASAQLRKQEKQMLPDGLETLPEGWQWATLMQCSLLVVDCHNKTAPYSTTGITLIRTTNVRDGRINLKEPKFVDEKTYERWSARCQPEPGDILITREAPMGEVCIVPENMKICLGQRMMLARLVPKTIDPQFMLITLRDPRLMDRVQDKPVGATVQHLRVGGVETLLVPLPPLAEQHRIVAKVNELMALCDRLEAKLTTTQAESRRLLESVLHQALAA